MYYPDLQEPLIELLRKSEKFIIDERILNAFYQLKQNITDAALLSYPRGSNNFTIICDMSETAVSAVLLQNQERKNIPLEFASKSLSSSERNWDVYEREAYVIRWAVSKFGKYIKINCTTILTNQPSLERLMKADNGKIKRWALYIKQFILKIKYIKSKDNILVDWLSRLLDKADPFNNEMTTIIPTFNVSELPIDTAKNIQHFILFSNATILYLLSYD